MSRRSARLFLLVILVACAHPDAFPSGDPGDGGPFSGTPPVRLTFNPARDRTPAWSSDGAALYYTYEQGDRADQDQCLGLLPAVGGTRQAARCPVVDLNGDSVDVFDAPAESPSGRLAWVSQQGVRGLVPPRFGTILIGDLDPSHPPVIARTMPYLAPSGLVHLTATNLTWLGADSLAYVGTDLLYSGACQNCKLDTLVTGREIVTLDLTSSPPTLGLVPGTAGATALWAEPGQRTILYTLAGDSRVFARDLATGTVSTLFDFGVLGIARDPSRVGARLTAVVGGRVFFTNHPILGPIQVDSGGTAYVVDLPGGTPQAVTPPDQLVRRAALHPSGTSLVAEATDTAGPFVPDLFLYQVP